MAYGNYNNYLMFVNRKMTKFMHLAKADAQQHSVYSVGNIFGKHITYDIFHAGNKLPKVFRNSEKVSDPGIIKNVLIRAGKFCFKEHGIFPGNLLRGLPVEDLNKVLSSRK